MEIIRVYATTPAAAVAGAITGVVLEYHKAEVQAVGADAVNQAIEGLALATRYLKHDGICVSCVPELSEVTIENQVKTAINLLVEPAASASSSPEESPVDSTSLEFAPM
jgi:stage V sporulation protein S